MLRKLNLHEIPREIRDILRQLQDAYNEKLDLNSLDTSSEEYIEPGEPEENNLELGVRGGKGGINIRAENLEPSRNKVGQNRDLRRIKYYNQAIAHLGSGVGGLAQRAKFFQQVL